jgi:hypothetical protein
LRVRHAKPARVGSEQLDIEIGEEVLLERSSFRLVRTQWLRNG